MSQKRIFAQALIITIACLVVPAKAQNFSWNDVRENNRRAIVYLHGDFTYPNGLIESIEGTGFLIHPDGWILTCAHVVPEAKKDGSTVAFWASIGGRGEYQRAVKVTRRDPNKDLALLLLEHQAPNPWPTVEIDTDWVLRPDQRVYTLGFAAASPDSLDGTQGTIRSRFGEYWLTDASINPGNSGGPVFSEEGRVVGIAMGTKPNANQMNVVIPIRLAEVWFNEVGITSQSKSNGSSRLQDRIDARYGITLGWQLGRFEFIDGSPIPEAQKEAPIVKRQIVELLSQDKFPHSINNLDARQIMATVISFYGTTSLKKHAYILMGIGAMRSSLVGASSNADNNKELEGLAASAIRSIDRSIIADREAFTKMLISSHPTNVEEVLDLLERYGKSSK